MGAQATIRAKLTTRPRARVIVVQQPTKRLSSGAEVPAFDFSGADQFGKVEILAPNGRDILTPDIFRERNPGKTGLYTWWSFRSAARQRNVGWRIDYTCISPGLKTKVKDAFIQPDIHGSDHCPVGIELKS